MSFIAKTHLLALTAALFLLCDSTNLPLRSTNSGRTPTGLLPPQASDGSIGNPFTAVTAFPVQWFAHRRPSDHQNDLNFYPRNGYRLISLSVYGTPPNHMYTTVWVQRTGPLQQTTMAVDSASFNSWWFYWTDLGYVPSITTATGDATAGYVYAAVLEKISVGSWNAVWDQTAGQLETASVEAAGKQQKMVSIGQYGKGSTYLFCAIFHHNPNFDKWWYSSDQLWTSQYFWAQTSKPFWRPAYLSLYRIAPGTSPRLSTIYTDSYVGSWAAKFLKQVPEITAEDAAQKAQGRQLIHLQGGYSGLLNAIWAERDSPSPRVFRATGGTATGFRDNAMALAKVDGIMQSFMQRTGVRQAQIAIGKTGNILLERAYTWSEPEHHITQTSDTFLLASLSKMFCEAAVQSLIDSGKISLGTRPWVDFGLDAPWRSPGPLPDSRYSQITIEHLLNHKAGWNRRESVDWEFEMIQISQYFGLSTPPSISNFVEYLRSKVRLDFAPGTDAQYSNVGYIVLSQVVESVSGKKYFDYLKSTVLDPVGLGSDVKLWLTDASNHVNDPVTQESSNWGPNVQTPQDATNMIASVFGGDGAYKETAVGPSSLACSAATLVKFMSKHAVWGNGPRCNRATTFPEHGCYRDGLEEGARGWAESRPDGLDWAVVLNTREFAGGDNVFTNAVVAGGISAFLDTGPVL